MDWQQKAVRYAGRMAASTTGIDQFQWLFVQATIEAMIAQSPGGSPSSHHSPYREERVGGKPAPHHPPAAYTN
jgi:hypothetical protein